MQDKSDRRLEQKAWTGAFITTVSILILVPFARTLETYLRHLFGSNFPIFFSILTFGTTFPFLIRFVWQPKTGRYKRLILFCIFTYVFLMKFKSMNVIVERFHLFEYGLLAIFSFWICMSRRMGIISIGWSFLAVWLVGLLDETFQWIWPNRVGEWRDVVINMESGLLGLFASIILMIGRRSFNYYPWKKWESLFFASSFLTMLSCIFFFHVQEFGYRNFDPEIGYFNSYFSSDQLLSITPAIYHLMEIGAETGSSSPIYSKRLKFYQYEGEEHYNRIKLLVDRGKYQEALSEYLLFTKYFSAYHQILTQAFSPEILSILQSTHSLRPIEFESAVMDWLIVSFDINQVVLIFSIVEIFFLLMGVFFSGYRFT